MTQPAPTGPDPALRSLLAGKRWKFHHILLLAAIAAFLVWSANGVDLNLKDLFHGIPVIVSFFGLMLPPEWGFGRTLVQPAAETVYISLWGVALATLIGLPLGILAAGNVNSWTPVRVGVKGFLNLLRSISELIWAIFFVAAVGLGPFPGALALGMNYGGILGRLYAEAIEITDPGPIEALRATGANPLQVVLFGIFPQVLPQIVTYTLYWFEVGVRSATVLGMVGAGGIGFELVTTIRLFEFRQTGIVLLVILGMVTVIDFGSTHIRSRIY